MDLPFWVQTAALVTFVCSVFNYVVLQPLKTAITELKQMVADLRDEMRHAERDRHKMEERLALAEQSLKALHRRLDKVEGKTYELD